MNKIKKPELIYAFSFSLVILLSLVFAPVSRAQVPFWTEIFDLPCSGNCEANGYVSSNGAWSVTTLAGNTGSDPNVWYVSCAEAGMAPNNCGQGCPGPPPPPPSPFIGQSLHIGSNASIFGDLGASFFSGSGIPGTLDASTELRAESPVINCSGHTSINLDFSYIENGDATSDNAEVWYFNGAVWAFLADMPKTQCCDGLGNVIPCTGVDQGYWSAFSIALPASANNNANVKIGFRWVNNNDALGDDPSVAITAIVLSDATASNSVTTGALPNDTLCAGATFTLPFTSLGTFNSGNVYTAQLSDATGSFLAPIAIGTLNATTNVGTISVTIPAGTPPGNGYVIRVISSNPAVIGSLSIPFVVLASSPLSATITVSPNDTICVGTQVTFTVNVTNGGTSPSYQWKINNVNVPGATASTFTSTTIANNNSVTCVVTSNLPCVSGSPFTTPAIVMHVITAAAFNSTVTTIPNPPVLCQGDPLIVEVTTQNGGLSPTFVWFLNGVQVPLLPGTDSINTASLPGGIQNGDTIMVVASSSLGGCVTNSPDTTYIGVTVNPNVNPAITIIPNPGPYCEGDQITLNTSYTQAGTNPVFQWFVNGQILVGATADSLVTSSLNAGDTVTCQITSSLNCVSNPVAVSAPSNIVILPQLTPSVAFAATQGLCPGQNVNFTVTAIGNYSGTTYHLFLNDTIELDINFINPTTFTLNINSSLVDGDILNLQMISTYPCASVDTVYSADLVVNVLAPATVDAGPDLEITYGESHKIEPDINGPLLSGQYSWTPDSIVSCYSCLTTVVRPFEDVDLIIVYTNSSGCRAIDTVKIDVKPNYEVFIPSAFSPNDDNINDEFYIRGPFIRESTMEIWDRWGNLMFKSMYNYYGWDGTYNYKELDSGVFVYYITVTFKDGVQKTFSGNITLNR